MPIGEQSDNGGCAAEGHAAIMILWHYRTQARSRQIRIMKKQQNYSCHGP